MATSTSACQQATRPGRCCTRTSASRRKRIGLAHSASPCPKVEPVTALWRVGATQSDDGDIVGHDPTICQGIERPNAGNGQFDIARRDLYIGFRIQPPILSYPPFAYPAVEV